MVGHKKLFVLILLLLWGVLQQCMVTSDNVIQKQLFDLNWKFSPENHSMAHENGFNDINWRSLDLPHNWSTDSTLIESPWKAGTVGKTTKTGWYRKSFEIPENWAEKKVVIEFDGISAKYEVFVNGISIKHSENGKQHTKADLTAKLKPNNKNLIAIRIDVTNTNDFSPEPKTGLFGHVWLVIKNNKHHP